MAWHTRYLWHGWQSPSARSHPSRQGMVTRTARQVYAPMPICFETRSAFLMYNNALYIIRVHLWVLLWDSYG